MGHEIVGAKRRLWAFVLGVMIGISPLLGATAGTASALKSAAVVEDDAPTARKAHNIERLLMLLDVWGTTASLGPVIADEFAQSLSSDNPEMDRAVTDSFRQALLDVLGSDLDNASSLLRQSYADLYDRNFNAREIEELVKFYSSPTGQKYVSQQRHLVNDSAIVLQAWLNGAKDRVIVRFEELMALRGVVDETAATN